MLALAAPSHAPAQPSPEVLQALPPVIEELRREEERSRAEADGGRFDRIFQELERQLAASEAAAEAAIAADAAGADPAAALRPVAALEGRTPPLPRLAASVQTVSPRTTAYGRLIARWDPTVAADGPRPSRALALAAATAWEAELTALRREPIIQVEVGALAHAYARLGEPAAARRAADLDPREGPLARLEVLAEAQAWDEAADLAARTTADEVAAALLREVQLEYEAEKAARSPARARLAALLPETDGAPDPAQIRQEAEAGLAQAREQLAAAARRWADEVTARRIEARLARDAAP